MIDVMMITKNEALNVPYSLKALQGWTNKVFVVDSGSTDGTQDIARSLGAEVVHHDWPGYAKQKNWGLDNLPFESDWIFILDADEVILPELRDELLAVAKRKPDDVEHAGFHINRYFIFLGKRIRHCGYYPSWNLRYFRRGKARYEEREVHEHMVVDGSIGFLKGHMEHNDRRGLEDYIAKHNHYSTLEARETVRQLKDGDSGDIDAKFFGDPLQRRRWIKHKVYPKLPMKWLFRFGFMYILKLGILDGINGFRFCLLMSAYEQQIQLKILEILQNEQEAAEANVPAAPMASDEASS
ncbi:MAG: glycosyltransferase family 2 protein [Planctomycetota bacterium]